MPKKAPLLLDVDVKALTQEELHDVLECEDDYRKTYNYRMAKEIQFLRERLIDLDSTSIAILEMTEYIDYIRT